MTSILNDIIILLLIFYDEMMLTLLSLSELNRNVIEQSRIAYEEGLRRAGSSRATQHSLPEERDINQADVTRALGTVDAELVFAGPKKSKVLLYYLVCII